MPNIENLSTAELLALVQWFLHFMSQDQRRKLMAESPLVYAKLYPQVSSARILSVVAESLENRPAV